MSTPQNPQPTSSYTLPPSLTPETLETLPVLRTILDRLSIPTTGTTSTQPTSQPSQTSPPAISTPSQQAPTSSSATAKDSSSPLLLKDIPQATDSLRHKIQRARVQVKELPDMERSIEEQEQEMRELEEKIRLQRAVLRGLKEKGAEFLAEGKRQGDDVMDTGS